MKKRTSKPKPSSPIRKKRKLYRPLGSVEYTSARGKTVEQVYVTADKNVNCVTLCFTDKTELVVDVEPCVAFSADYSDWTTGTSASSSAGLPCAASEGRWACAAPGLSPSPEAPPRRRPAPPPTETLLSCH